MVKKSSELYIKCPDGEYAELPMVLQRRNSLVETIGEDGLP